MRERPRHTVDRDAIASFDDKLFSRLNDARIEQCSIVHLRGEVVERRRRRRASYVPDASPSP
jgi:hypothetical protein